MRVKNDPNGLLDLLTRAEVAKLLRVHETTLSRWAAVGKGPLCVYVAPGVPRYRRADLLSYLKNC